MLISQLILGPPTQLDDSGKTSPPSPVPLLERFQFLQRQTTLLFVLMGVTIVAFFLTRSLAGTTRALHQADAAQWHALGRQHLAEGDAASAITALRRAVAGDRDNRDVQLALAGAYLAAAQPGEARDVLLEIRGRLPDDPEVNFRLARLEAAGGQPEEAIRFYQAALLGLWGQQQLEQRRQLRIEFVEFLLDHELPSRALSESLLLDGEMPADAASHVRLGEFLLRAGDPGRALLQFEAALAFKRRDPDALARAGEAAFQAGSFRQAHRYLRQVPGDRRARGLLPVTELIVALDPLLPGLASSERHRRVATAARRLETELAACRATFCERADTRCAQAEALAREVSATRAVLRKRSRGDDPVDPGLAIVAGLAARTAALCGGDAPIFRALALIAAQHGAAP